MTSPSNYHSIEELLRKDLQRANAATYRDEYEAAWHNVTSRGSTLRNIVAQSDDPNIAAAFQQIQDEANQVRNRLSNHAFPEQCAQCHLPFYPAGAVNCPGCNHPVTPTVCPPCLPPGQPQDIRCPTCSAAPVP